MAGRIEFSTKIVDEALETMAESLPCLASLALV
jgi:hypothetical protein